MTDTILTRISQLRDTGRGQTYIEGGSAQFVTYAELIDHADRIARRLPTLGAGQGVCVALAITSPRQFVAHFFGAILAGAIPVAVAPPVGLGRRGWRGGTAKAILEKTRAGVVVADDEVGSLFRELSLELESRPRVVSTSQIAVAQPGPRPVTKPNAEDTAFLQFTSGSTGLPSGVVVRHGQLVANVQAIANTGLRLDAESDLTVSWLPLHHDMGLVGFVIVPFMQGLNAVLVSPREFMRRPTSWFDLVHQYRGTVTFAPNFAFALMLRRVSLDRLRKWDLSCLRVLGCGAEPIDAGLLERFSDTFHKHGRLPDTAIVPAYGMAEATLAISFSNVGRRFSVDAVDADELANAGCALPASGTGRVRRIVSCGRPLPGVQVRIIGGNGSEVGERCTGEIVVKGDSISSSYLGDDKGGGTFRGEWLHTGDIGYLADGELFVSGRRKDIIISRGRKYHSVELEGLVAEIEAASAGAVVAFSVPSEETERAVMVVECARSASKEIAARILAYLHRTVDLEIAEVVTVPPGRLPRTSSGKFQRSHIRSLYLEGQIAKLAWSS